MLFSLTISKFFEQNNSMLSIELDVTDIYNRTLILVILFFFLLSGGLAFFCLQTEQRKT